MYSTYITTILKLVVMSIAVIKTSSTVGSLSHSSSYIGHLNAIKRVPTADSSGQLIDNIVYNKHSLEDDSEYKLIIECNRMLQEVDDEISVTKRFVSEIYSKKFIELESLIPNKIDYIKTVKLIGNEMDLTLVNLNEVLTPSLVMIVSVSGSTTSGQRLSEIELNECYRGCNEVLKLDHDRSLMLQFVESRMSKIAPNLCTLIGAHIAAQLVGLAGGLIALSKIPACNIQVMGQEKHKNLIGLSLTSSMPHTGILYYCQLVQTCPPALRKKALKIVSAKVSLASRIDSYQSNYDTTQGERLKIEVEERLEKEQDPHTARTKKALPIPEEKKRSKRGGKRVRKMKERYMVTELGKQQNKMTFSTDVGEYGDSAMGTDKGMVGSKDSGRIRAPQVKESAFLKKQKKAVSVSSGQTSGMSSSLAFSTVQGLELVNPNASMDRVKEANNKWFNSQSGFLSAAPKS